MLMNFYKEANNYIPFELLIQTNTTIEYLGQHQAHVVVPLNRALAAEVAFEDVGRARGIICEYKHHFLLRVFLRIQFSESFFFLIC